MIDDPCKLRVGANANSDIGASYRHFITGRNDVDGLNFSMGCGGPESLSANPEIFSSPTVASANASANREFLAGQWATRGFGFVFDFGANGDGRRRRYRQTWRRRLRRRLDLDGLRQPCGQDRPRQCRPPRRENEHRSNPGCIGRGGREDHEGDCHIFTVSRSLIFLVGFRQR